MGTNFMMFLGLFPFMIKTATYNELRRSASYNWEKRETMGSPWLRLLGTSGLNYQYIAPGPQTISLSGVLYPGQQGMRASTNILRIQAGLGFPLPLIGFSGAVFGLYVVNSVEETQSEFTMSKRIVKSRKIDFSVSLERYSGSDALDAIFASFV